MTTENLESLLNGAVREYRSGTDERGCGELEKAKEHYLRAAEKLFLAANASHGRLRESRMQLAQGLLAEADLLQYAPSIPRVTKDRQIAVKDDQQSQTWLVQARPQVSFDDIAGLDQVKEQIRLKLLYPFTHPEIARQYNIHAGGGILLYGPPGTGKTLIARAVAGEIQAAFFAIKPSEIMSQWVGVAEQNIAKLFAEAEGYPLSVVFIDEVESLSPKRRSSGSTVMQRVVPQLLAELDGFEQRRNPLLLIGATNEPWAIDGAILRPGRLDRLIYVPPPDEAARQCILELNLEEVPLSEDVSLEEVAASTAGFSGADMAALAQRARERVFTEAVHQGVVRPIGVADFEAELADMRPSIPQKDLRMFEKLSLIHI